MAQKSPGKIGLNIVFHSLISTLYEVFNIWPL